MPDGSGEIDEEMVMLVITKRNGKCVRLICAPFQAMLEIYEPEDDWASARILADDVDMGFWDRSA